jgi:hypothetical protein
MLSTIHTTVDDVVKVRKRVFDYETGGKKEVEIERLVINDDYNHNMNAVDVCDQLRKMYEFGGKDWRNYKWSTPVVNAIIKTAADAAYMLYLERVRLDQATLDGRRAAECAPADSPARGVRARAQAIKLTPRTHLQFQGKISEGLIVHAYNEQKGITEPLDVMTADPFEVTNLLARGGKATVHAPSRRPPEASGSSTCVTSSQGHRLEPIVKADRATNPYCRYEHCPYGMKNKKQKCGEGSVRAGWAQPLHLLLPAPELRPLPCGLPQQAARLGRLRVDDRRRAYVITSDLDGRKDARRTASPRARCLP